MSIYIKGQPQERGGKGKSVLDAPHKAARVSAPEKKKGWAADQSILAPIGSLFGTRNSGSLPKLLRYRRNAVVM
jgi:hypothetical protein